MPNRPMPRKSFALLAAAFSLAACAGEPRRAEPASPAVARALAAVRLDPAQAAATFNAYRASLGLAPLRLDPALSAMAQRQADAMVAANSMSHELGGGFSARLYASGVKFTEAGENLGGGYHSTDEAFVGWRHSPEHDANLRLAHATHFGVALAKDPQTRYRVYWAMEVAAERLP